MTEEFIHFLWKFRLLSHELALTDGSPIRVLHPGEHNTNSGPDFFNARVRIADTLWAGNVEIHVNASDWLRHGHAGDKAYDNIILHVVMNDDAVIRRENGEPLPTLVIRGAYPVEVFSRYRAMMESRLRIPCQNMLRNGAVETFRLWAPSLAVDRLTERSQRLKELWLSAGQNWEETLYRLLARGFGFKINVVPFELLSRTLPLRLIQRHRGQQVQLEALLFGQAGMLDSRFGEDYPRRLRMEYEFLQAKYDLVPVSGSIWKFMRLRPCNFPTIRISQFGQVVSRKSSLLEEITGSNRPEQLTGLFDIQAAPYWDTHFTFEKLSPAKPKKLGLASARLLVTNTLAPFLFFYGLENGKRDHRERAIGLLEELPGEENSELRPWVDAGMTTGSALDTQALLQLRSVWCDRKRCTECRIGKYLLSNHNDNEVETGTTGLLQL